MTLVKIKSCKGFIVSLMITTLVRAVKGGSCLKNIITLWSDALINDTLNITQPSAQLTKV